METCFLRGARLNEAAVGISWVSFQLIILLSKVTETPEGNETGW